MHGATKSDRQLKVLQRSAAAGNHTPEVRLGLQTGLIGPSPRKMLPPWSAAWADRGGISPTRLTRTGGDTCARRGCRNPDRGCYAGLHFREGASGWHWSVKRRTSSHRKIPRWMGHQDSSCCRECSNGHNFRPVTRLGSRCTRGSTCCNSLAPCHRDCPCLWIGPTRGMKSPVGARSRYTSEKLDSLFLSFLAFVLIVEALR
jgi:hypothetical protein